MRLTLLPPKSALQTAHQDPNGNFLLQVYDPSYPSELQTVTVRKDLKGISYGWYYYASYIDYTAAANAMSGIHLFGNAKDPSLYLSINSPDGTVTNSDGKGIAEIEGAYEQKPFHANAEEETFSGIKSFVLPKGNYKLTAKEEEDTSKEENTENTGETVSTQGEGNADAEATEEEKEPVIFYLASEENFAEIPEYTIESRT